MELTTILGMVVGIAAIILAMIFKGVDFGVFKNPAALVVIFAGTAASVLGAFPGKDLKVLGKLFKILFTIDKGVAGEAEIINTIITLCETARKDGLLALEEKANDLTSPFMAKGVRMIVDGAAEEYIRDVLGAELEAMEERHHRNANIFAQAGMYAPTLGVLGAVFGLIAAMGHLDEVEAMGHAVSAAFIATILGIFTGYVMWNPFANKLKVKSSHEVFLKGMMIEGILSIQKGESPVLLRAKLMSSLSQAEQDKIQKELDAANGE